MQIPFVDTSATAPTLGAWGRFDDLALTFAASRETQAVINQAVALGRSLTPSILGTSRKRLDKSLEESLYDALSDVKVYTSQVAMHMDREWRSKLFRQLDSLLDAEEWLEGDRPLRKESFATFLKVMFLFRPEKRPGLGLSADGNLIGAWSDDKARLTIECLSNDMTRWIVSHHIGGEVERAAGEASATRLSRVLSPYCPDRWLQSAAGN